MVLIWIAVAVKNEFVLVVVSLSSSSLSKYRIPLASGDRTMNALEPIYPLLANSSRNEVYE